MFATTAIHLPSGELMSAIVVVGVRITREERLSFFGVDEVNAAVKAGKRVTAL